MRRAIFATLVVVAVAIGFPPMSRGQELASNSVTSAKAKTVSTDGRQTRFTGDVTITMNGMTIQADEAIYTRATNDLELRGNVHVTLPAKAPRSLK